MQVQGSVILCAGIIRLVVQIFTLQEEKYF